MLAGLRAKLGLEHLATIEAHDRLGSALRDQGKLSEAEPLFREQLSARRAQRGDEHAGTLEAAVELAVVPRGLGSFREAECCSAK